MDDYYTILGISPTSTLDEIKERFRFLAQAYHPDKFGSLTQKAQAEEEFKKINEAYQVLSNSIKRANYDRTKSTRSNYPTEDLRRKQQAEAESKRKQAEATYRRAQEEQRKKDEAEKERKRQEQANAERERQTREEKYNEKPFVADDSKDGKNKILIRVILVVVVMFLIIWFVDSSRKSIAIDKSLSTPTLNPVAVYTHIAITQTSLIFDDFSNNDRKWPVESDSEGSVELYRNSYRIQIAPYHESANLINSGNNLRDIIVQVEASRIGGDEEGTFGVFCRYGSDIPSFIFFIITGNGNYSVGRFDNNDITYLVTGSSLSTIRSGSINNTIRASCIGKYLTLEVNNKILATAIDQNPIFGDAGMYASAISSVAGVDVTFDNFILAIP